MVTYPIGTISEQLACRRNIPADPAEHAVDFAKRYAEKLDRFAAERMEELGIPLERIGSLDHDHGIAWAAFNPHERDGGGISPGGRINLDSGALNPDLLTEKYGKKAGRLWAKSRYRDRQDALTRLSQERIRREQKRGRS